MKVLVLVFFIILYGHTFCVTDTSFSYGPGRGIDGLNISLSNAIKTKCVTDENFKQFQYAFDELGQCISDLMRESPVPFDLYDYNQDHCSYFNESQLRMCVENLTTTISSCLAGNEIYIQQFVLNAFDVLHEEFCGVDGISNKQYLYDKVNRTGECMKMCGLLVYYGSCNVTNLNVFKNLGDGVLNLNQDDVCSDLKSLYMCGTQLTEILCNEDYSRFMDLVFHPLLKNCNDLEANK